MPQILLIALSGFVLSGIGLAILFFVESRYSIHNLRHSQYMAFVNDKTLDPETRNRFRKYDNYVSTKSTIYVVSQVVGIILTISGIIIMMVSYFNY